MADKDKDKDKKKMEAIESQQPIVGPGSVGSTQRREAEPGSLTSFCPPRPLHMLPYYHGRKKSTEVDSLLRNRGDYLVVTDTDSGELVLWVRSETGKNQQQPIVKRQLSGKYVIEGEREHHAQGFVNVEELITYYGVYGLSVKEDDTQPAAQLTLDNAVTARPDKKPPSDRRRPFRQLKDLQHFHGRVSEAEAEKSLMMEGDYLLREDPENRGVYVLSARTRDGCVHHAMQRDPTSGGYVLPRESEDTPLECVAMIDEWVQFHVLYKVPLLGKVALERAIVKPKPKP